MKALLIVLALSSAALSGPTAPADLVRLIPVEGEGAQYWSRWRGPTGQGHAMSATFVDSWSDSTNVKWKARVPGIGHSSPIVWQDHIFLTTAESGGAKLSMLAFRRRDGVQLWQTVVPSTGVEHKYPKNSHASATPVTDGRLVFASFGTHGLAAFDFDGRLVWRAKVGDLNNYHGSAGSPVLYRDRIFLYQDHGGTNTTGSFVAAFEAASGQLLWKTNRTAGVGWGTPIVIQAGDHDELIVSGQRRVTAYDPSTGRERWTVRGNSDEVIPTPVVGFGLVFCSSGRQGPTFAITPGGTGDVTGSHVAWSTVRGSPFVPSGILHGEYLYLVNDMQSILTVLNAKTGATIYQARLGDAMREGFSSSPVAVGDRLFFTNDLGETFVVAAGPSFKLLRMNYLHAQVLASPALVDGTWFWRTDRELIAIGGL